MKKAHRHGSKPRVISARGKETHMQIIDTLVRLGCDLHDVVIYRKVADVYGVSYRVVRRTHEANWPMCRRMMELERDLIRIRGEYAELKGLLSPASDNVEPMIVDGRLIYPEAVPMNTERSGIDAALKTLKLAISEGYIPPIGKTA